MGFELQVHADYEEGKEGYIEDGTVKLVTVPYTRSQGSLMWTTYNALFFTAIRK